MRKLVVAVALALASCGSAESVAKAGAGVETFHTQFDSRDFDGIWRTSGQGMKDAGPKAEFVKFLEAVNRKLGPVESSKRLGWRANATPKGLFVVVQQETAFAKGNGQETFTFQKHGDRYELVGYNINSKELIIN